MWPFRPSRDPLQQRSPETTADLMVRLLKEQNDLLREVIVGLTGNQPRTLRAAAPRPAAYQLRTDKDVSRVTRETVLQQQRAEEERKVAPWRTPASGPASDSSSPKPGIDAPTVLPPNTM